MNKLEKILFIYPKFPANTYWSFKYALKFIKKKSAMPPLGLITVAALFPKKINIKLIDMNIEKLKKKDIENANAVFISAMMVQKESFDNVVSLCNVLSTPVIAGGPHVTTSHQEIKGVKHFLIGEVEDTLQKFLTDYEEGNANKYYFADERPDITNSALPRFDLLKMKAYSSMSIQYSRGCPFNCEFCDIWKVYGRKIRLKAPHKIIDELDVLYNAGWRDAIFFVDDNFIGYSSKVKNELLPLIQDWQKKHKNIFRFYTQASINMASDEDLLVAMRDAGFNSVFVGIETPSEDSLEETGKFQNLKTNLLSSIKKIQKYGMEVMGGFIVGFDNDKEDIFDRQIDFIQKAGIPKAMVGLLNALPGTDLFNRLKNEKRLTDFDLNGSNTHRLETNFITKMNPAKLKEGYKKILNSLYDKNLKNYFDRCNTLLDNIPKTDFLHRNVHFKEILIFIRSISLQPFTRYGRQYLKFIIRNYIKNKKAFGEAMCMAIEGHHFHKITQMTLKQATKHK